MSTDAQAVIDNAIRSANPKPIDTDGLYTLVLPNGSSLGIIDQEAHAPRPRRTKGTATFFTAESFSAYVVDHSPDPTAQPPIQPESRLYADVEASKVVAVLNDDTFTEVGWRDHRAELVLRPTPAWTRWIASDNRLLDQVSFAEHVETSLADVQVPSGAELLELATTFEAKNNVNFASAIVLETGQRQLVYEETIAAKAGQKGQLTIPKELILGLAPWEGSAPYKVVARLRFRIASGVLKIGYVLDRPDEILRAAFDDVVGQVEAVVQQTAYRGRPALPR